MFPMTRCSPSPLTDTEPFGDTDGWEGQAEVPAAVPILHFKAFTVASCLWLKAS